MLAGDVEVGGTCWSPHPPKTPGCAGSPTDRVRVERAARLGYAAMRAHLDAAA